MLAVSSITSTFHIKGRVFDTLTVSYIEYSINISDFGLIVRGVLFIYDGDPSSGRDSDLFY